MVKSYEKFQGREGCPFQPDIEFCDELKGEKGLPCSLNWRWALIARQLCFHNNRLFPHPLHAPASLFVLQGLMQL